MLSWIALAVLIAAGVYVVIRLARSWGIAWRRYGDRRSEEPSVGDPPTDAPPDPRASGPS